MGKNTRYEVSIPVDESPDNDGLVRKVDKRCPDAFMRKRLFLSIT